MIDRSILFPYAYNILGSAEDAKDVIQDVLSGYVARDREDVENEKNYLIQSVINRAINAKKRRRKIIGESEVWLPEPVATDDAADRNLYLKDILSYSLLVLLEKLQATERAVFILKESFDYTHLEIAQVLSITEEHSRKLLSRAKSKLFKPGPGTKDRNAHAANLLERYMDAIQRRDVPQLENLLSADIAYYADGGSKLQVVKKVCTGAPEVAELSILAYYRFLERLSRRLVWVNYQPALVYYDGERLAVCQVFEFDADGKIVQINTIIDPEKLRNDLRPQL